MVNEVGARLFGLTVGDTVTVVAGTVGNLTSKSATYFATSARTSDARDPADVAL